MIRSARCPAASRCAVRGSYNSSHTTRATRCHHGARRIGQGPTTRRGLTKKRGGATPTNPSGLLQVLPSLRCCCAWGRRGGRRGGGGQRRQFFWPSSVPPRPPCPAPLTHQIATFQGAFNPPPPSPSRSGRRGPAPTDDVTRRRPAAGWPAWWWLSLDMCSPAPLTIQQAFLPPRRPPPPPRAGPPTGRGGCGPLSAPGSGTELPTSEER